MARKNDTDDEKKKKEKEKEEEIGGTEPEEKPGGILRIIRIITAGIITRCAEVVAYSVTAGGGNPARMQWY